MSETVTSYRRLGSGTTGSFLRDKFLYILSVCGTFFLFLLFALWILILLFLINIDVRDVNNNQNDLSAVVANYVATYPPTSDGGDGGSDGDGDGDGGDGGDGSNTGGDTFNTYNDFITNTYSYFQQQPIDGLINSIQGSKVPCDLAPPIATLDQNFFNATIKALERKWLDLMVDLNIPGLSIAIVYDQQVLYSNNFGFANTTAGTRVNSNTLFRIGGLTRLFTTLLAYALRDAGKISLDDPITKYLPAFTIGNPFGSQTLTLRQLLSDISGLPRNAPPGCEPFGCDKTTAEVLDLIKTSGLSLINQPYSQPSRSDLAFALAGRGIETIPGLASYEAGVAQYITNKLGMSDTVFTLSAQQQQNLAAGYENEGAIINYDLGWMRPWGGLYSTQADMIKLLLALNFIDKNGAPSANKIVTTQTLREMELPAFMNPDGKTGHGTPFQIMYIKNKVARALGNSIVGYGSHMILVPNLRIGIVALANSGADVSKFTTPAAVMLVPYIEQLLNSKAPLPKPANKPSEFTGRFLGVNPKGETGTLSIIADSSGLLKAVDSRYPSTVFYQLDNLGADQRFRVTWEGDPLQLTCINIFNNGVDGEFMDFSSLGGGNYDSLTFQGEVYQRVSE